MCYSRLLLLSLLFCLGSASGSSTTLSSTHSLELTTPTVPETTLPETTAAWLPSGGASWTEGGTLSQVRELLSPGELCAISFCSLLGGPEYNFMVD